MPTSLPIPKSVLIRGRLFLRSEITEIRKMIKVHPTWGRTRLSEELCKKIAWKQPNGRLKDRACRVALLKMETLGLIDLPPKKLDRGGRPPVALWQSCASDAIITVMPKNLTLEPVQTQAQARAWNSMIATHHYLGLATPVGRLTRYIVSGDDQILGAISFADAAWSLTPRDVILTDYGLKKEDIRERVIANNRFLLLPHIQVKNIASRILSIATDQVTTDWVSKYSTRPLFIETFVDPRRFHGTCYRAANWTLIGRTRGYAKRGAAHASQNAPKLIFLFGVSRKEQRFLKQKQLTEPQRAA